MHPNERLGDFPEALPLHRVAPLWRIAALLFGVIVAALLIVVCVLGIAVMQQQQQLLTMTLAPPPPGAPATPVPPRWVGGMGVAVDEEERVDPQTLPYPVRDDLRDLRAA